MLTLPRRHTALTLSEVAIVLVGCRPAYDIVSVLDRLAPATVESAGAILVDVGGREDAVADGAQRWAAHHTGANVIVLQRSGAIGHGSRQKAGLRWALEHGHSVAVMVRGDGGPALVGVGEMVGPLLRGDADAVVDALPSTTTAGGSPLPLSAQLGRRVRASIDEWRRGPQVMQPSGCRAYNLHRLDMRLVDSMSDDARFDADILRHLSRHGRRVVEVPSA